MKTAFNRTLPLCVLSLLVSCVDVGSAPVTGNDASADAVSVDADTLVTAPGGDCEPLTQRCNAEQNIETCTAAGEWVLGKECEAETLCFDGGIEPLPSCLPYFNRWSFKNTHKKP